MSKFIPYDGMTFYGKTLSGKDVPGLIAEIRHGQKNGQSYSYIVYLNDDGFVKWKIAPTSFSKRGTPSSLRLYHRNRFGPRNRLHSQGQTGWGTPSGLAELVNYIQEHEQYEKRADL